jgi:hypothetical protein
MTESAKLRLPYIAASQAQKHVTHNEALTLLDTLVQASVIDKDLSTPPVSPEEGDCYIVVATGTGDWGGWDNRIARFIDGEWRSYLPGAGDGEGWLVYVQDEERLYVFDGAAWSQLFVSASISLATAAETLTGTEGSKAVTPDALAALWEKGSNVASAATISLGEGGYFHITGTTAITDIDFAVAKDGRAALLVFDGALTLTHNGTTLILPGGLNIQTAAGDACLVVQDASDNIKVVGFWRASGLREKLTADRTYYSRDDGSAGNNGLSDSAGGAFATPQQAMDFVAANLDFGSFTVTIKHGNQTNKIFTGALTIKAWSGGGALKIEGNGTANTLLNVAGSAISPAAPLPGKLTLKNLKLQATIYCFATAAACNVDFDGVEFGTCGAGAAHIYAGGPGVYVNMIANYGISGGGGAHWQSEKGGTIECGGRTITLTGSPVIGTFASISMPGSIFAFGNTFSGSAGAGTKRYAASVNGVIQTFGGGASAFPGDVAGTTATGGQYA